MSLMLDGSSDLFCTDKFCWHSNMIQIRILNFISQSFLKQAQMGQTVTQEDIAQGSEKIKQLKDKYDNLKKEIAAREFVKGDPVFESTNYTAMSDKEDKNTLIEGISKFVKAQATGDAGAIFDIIGQQLNALLGASIQGMVYDQFRAYPMVDKYGFVFCYFNFHLEKLTIKRGKSFYQQNVIMHYVKMVRPDPPKSEYDLGAFFVAAAIKEENKVQDIIKSLWRVIVKSKGIQEIRKQIEIDKAMAQWDAVNNPK